MSESLPEDGGQATAEATTITITTTMENQQQDSIANQTLEQQQQQQQPNPTSSPSPLPQIQEWESKTLAWLSTLPNNQSNIVVTINEFEAWINSNKAPPLPEQLKSLSASQLFERVLSAHKLMLPQSQPQVKEDNLVETPPARFQRTDQWKPVYSWLESLDKDEVIKSKEISDWLSENPSVKEKLFAKHSRYHLMHYIQKLHMKILKKRGKLPQASKPVSRDKLRTQSFTAIVPVVNDGGPTPAVPLSYKTPSDVLNDKDVSMVKRNDAFRRYQIFTELENHLSSLLPRH